MMTSPVLALSSPGDLLAAVPYLLGFPPFLSGCHLTWATIWG